MTTTLDGKWALVFPDSLDDQGYCTRSSWLDRADWNFLSQVPFEEFPLKIRWKVWVVGDQVRVV